jgi:hypothetical protein
MAVDRAATPRAILVTGYGNSGVTAVMDLLAECDGVRCPAQEFFLIQHPDGILALEDALVHSWSEFAPDWAIRRFRTLVHVLARRPTRFRFGLDYDRLFCPDFGRRALAYADRLGGVRYEGHLMFRRAEMGPAEHFAYMLSRRFDIGAGNRWFGRRYDTTFVAEPERFAAETVSLMNDLVSSIAGGRSVVDVALCLGASPYQVGRSARYFDRSATIIVDRDPRDIYLSARASSYMPREVGAFIRWYKSTRENASTVRDGKEVALEVMFEDLVTRYHETAGRILDFLGIARARHTRPKSRLVPEVSAKRIAKWKSCDRPDDIRRIERELDRYLWRSL